MKEIESLLPHRAPFLFVDEIISANMETIVGIKTFDEVSVIQGNLSDPNCVPGTLLIESMCQCGGAGARKLFEKAGMFGLANVESAAFHLKVAIGKTVKMVVKNIRLSERIIKQSGIAYVDETPVAEASWTCIRFK
jgi:3-hydroxyacyl-[acyl-carrier-protein] dehydratase